MKTQKHRDGTTSLRVNAEELAALVRLTCFANCLRDAMSAESPDAADPDAFANAYLASHEIRRALEEVTS